MVSVIVPVYNSEKTLPECVHSILRQTYDDYELILIDDGSKDRSGQICDELQKLCSEKGMQCQVIHQDNNGVSSARNCGMDHANGEYFVFIDSDDIVEPCYLEDLVLTAGTHPELGYVLCGFRCTSHVHDYVLTDKEELSIVDRRDYMKLFGAVLIQGPCLALYTTAAVRKNNIRMREDLSLAEDILFNLAYLDALERPLIGIINKPNYIYQDEDPHSLYRKYRQDLLTINETVNQAVANYMRKWGITGDSAWRKYYITAFNNYRIVFDNTFHKKNPMSIKEKLAYNNAIMGQKSFREVLENSAFSLSPALKRAYESGDYRRVRSVERIQKAKRAISGMIKK